MSAVSSHGEKTDCWIVLHDKVYNITGFIAMGKHAIDLSWACGKDVTTQFETRPAGSGTPHSETARTLAENFYIGDLAKG
ncbi:MAG: cytochrome b5-like heme/steroid binding domain-containing protein, partial [Acidobacteriota bacterium]